MRSMKLVLALPVVLGLSATQAHAQLTITPTFDSSITSLSNAGAVESSINNALAIYSKTFTNPINVTIDFQSVGSGLGASGYQPIDLSYSDYRTALLGESSISSVIAPELPGTNPVPNNANAGVEATSAQLRAIGSPNGLGAPEVMVGSNTYDDYVKLNLGSINLDGQSDPNNYDIQGVVQHEVDEVLGLSSALDGTKNSPLVTTVPNVDSLDFYRYSAPGVRSFTNDVNAVSYFSLDSGVTPIVYFNQNGDGDFHDWASASNGDPHGGPPQVQDAFGSPNTPVALGPTEILALESIGYNVVNPVPEASSSVSFGLLLTFGLGGMMIAAKRRKTAVKAGPGV